MGRVQAVPDAGVTAMRFERKAYYEIETHAIDVPEGRRAIDEKTVEDLKESMGRFGLLSPISIRDFVLVTGAHRLEAARRLGWKQIFVRDVSGLSDEEAEMVEISENLHRSDLTVLERSTQAARWIELSKLSQLATVSGGRGNEGGIRAAARELGIDKDEAHRSVKIASLSEDARKAAVEVGLDDNKTALLAAAKAGPDRQASVIRDIAEKKAAGRNKIDADVKSRAAREVAEIIAEHVPGEWWDGLKANLYAAGSANIAHELTNITGQSIMDRRYGSA
jgi:ParB-like chromosome segregation protein Spo0J